MTFFLEPVQAFEGDVPDWMSQPRMRRPCVFVPKILELLPKSSQEEYRRYIDEGDVDAMRLLQRVCLGMLVEDDPDNYYLDPQGFCWAPRLAHRLR